jgi:hypothetical protein
MSKKLKYPFKALLSEIAKLRELDAADREHLSRWADVDRNDHVWSKISVGIRRTWGLEPDLYARFFVQEVLSLRKFVRNPNLRPPYLDRARDAERIARFLRGDIGLPPPMPQFPNYAGLAESLSMLSKMLQEQAGRSNKLGLVKPSRKTNSLMRSDFSRLISDLLQSLCGKPLDNETATLTQIAFNENKADKEFARNARRRAMPTKPQPRTVHSSTRIHR